MDRLVLLVVVFLTPALGAADEERKPIWLAVGKAGLVEELEPLAAHRAAGGLEPLLSTASVKDALESCSSRPAYLLLVGDHERGHETEPWFLPAEEKPFYRWMTTQRHGFASDNARGDLDGDGIQDIPVGRIPARTRDEVAAVVKKIIAFERRPASSADLRLNLWGGTPNYGPEFDAIQTGFLLGTLQQDTPRWLDLWIISSDLDHPLCGWPLDQADLFSNRVAEGGLINALMGHATADFFLSINFNGLEMVYTAAKAGKILSRGDPTAPLFFFSCDSGNFARKTPCMAESFLFFPAGPVATIAATTNSHPLTNYFSSTEMARGLRGNRARYGDFWLDAQKRARDRKLNFLTFVENKLKDIEGKLEKEINVEKLKRDQMLMFAFLGDPATRIRLPRKLNGSVEERDVGWFWRVEKPEGATAIEVAFRSNEQALLPDLGRPATREEANRRFHEINAHLGYSLLPAPGADEPWEGLVARKGLLRLVATGRETCFVAVFEID